jgi:transposase
VAPAIELNPVMKATLDHLARSASTPQALALRSRIVLAAAAGQANQQIATALQVPEVAVGKWRRCFASQGLDGLQDAVRSGRPPKHGQEILQKVQNRACQQPEHYSRWSVRTLATDLGLPSSTGHQMLVASGLQPHRIRTFTFSPDPDFEAKLLDIVGLYLNPTTTRCCSASMKRPASRPRTPSRSCGPRDRRSSSASSRRLRNIRRLTRANSGSGVARHIV